MSSAVRALSLTLCSLLLAACVSTEPRSLVPSITLSPEAVSLSAGEPVGRGLNFGMSMALNESDSLSNITVLPGVRIRAVTPGGAADLAGLRAGDVILRIDEREVNHPDLVEALAQQSDTAGAFVLEVRRATTVFQTTLNARPQTDERAEVVELYRADPVATRAAYVTEIYDTAGGTPRSGARIVELFEDSPLPAAGLQVGDTILALDDIPVTSAQDLITRLNTEHDLGDHIHLSVVRDTAMALENFGREVRLWSPGRRLSRLSLGPLLQYESSLTPARTQLAIGDLWLFSLFRYRHEEGEKEYSLLSLFRFATGYGELAEEEQP